MASVCLSLLEAAQDIIITGAMGVVKALWVSLTGSHQRPLFHQYTFHQVLCSGVATLPRPVYRTSAKSLNSGSIFRICIPTRANLHLY